LTGNVNRALPSNVGMNVGDQFKECGWPLANWVGHPGFTLTGIVLLALRLCASVAAPDL
jgi:hypothetical protein